MKAVARHRGKLRRSRADLRRCYGFQPRGRWSKQPKSADAERGARVGESDIAIGGCGLEQEFHRQKRRKRVILRQCPRSHASLRILKLPGRRIHPDGTDEHLVQTPPVGKAALLGDCLETERGVAQKQLLGAAHPAFG